MGVDVCDKWAAREPDRLAIHEVSEDDSVRDMTFGSLRGQSNQLANALGRLGIKGLGAMGEVGDRVGVLLPQCLETALVHIAVWKMGGISLPLFTLFGQDALLHRLRDSGAKAIITNSDGVDKLAAFRDQLPDLELVFFHRWL